MKREESVLPKSSREETSFPLSEKILLIRGFLFCFLKDLHQLGIETSTIHPLTFFGALFIGQMLLDFGLIPLADL